ncbi:MAG TPA: aldehyde dehydrogenase family protein, partial [Bacillota bacterium]|nr:aldehyde dehydrogenase family protein [Bacillota bacterium]
ADGIFVTNWWSGDKRYQHFVERLLDVFEGRVLELPAESHGNMAVFAFQRTPKEQHFDRLKNLLDNQKIAIGGKYNADTLKIEPTVIDDVFEDNVIMDDEIFGPILPIMTFKEIEEAHAYINRHPKPLALYLFTNDKANQKATLRSCNFGGGCINDVVVHVASDSLPFGGVGESGMGNYHGKASFDTFTHYRSILHKANWLDTQFRYAPYTKIKEKIIKIFLR